MPDMPEIIEEFISSGLDVHYGFAKRIRSESPVPHLVQILEADEYWKPDGPGNGWPSIHAIHLLPEIATDECLQVLMNAVREREEELGDFATEDVPSLIAQFGPPAKNPALSLLRDETLSPYTRHSGSRALVVLAKRRPEFEDEAVKSMREAMEGGGTLADLVAIDLFQFQREDILDELETAYAEGELDPLPAKLAGIQEISKVPDEELTYHKDEKEGLDHFLPQNLRRLWKANPRSQKPSKVGRNDPCPCNSGEKYKRCCLPEIRKRKKKA